MEDVAAGGVERLVDARLAEERRAPGRAAAPGARRAGARGAARSKRRASRPAGAQVVAVDAAPRARSAARGARSGGRPRGTPGGPRRTRQEVPDERAPSTAAVATAAPPSAPASCGEVPRRRASAPRLAGRRLGDASRAQRTASSGRTGRRVRGIPTPLGATRAASAPREPLLRLRPASAAFLPFLRLRRPWRRLLGASRGLPSALGRRASSGTVHELEDRARGVVAHLVLPVADDARVAARAVSRRGATSVSSLQDLPVLHVAREDGGPGAPSRPSLAALMARRAGRA